MLRSKITRQLMQYVNVFGCFNFFRLLQLNEIYRQFVPFIKTLNITLQPIG